MKTDQIRGEQIEKQPERRSPYIERVIIRNFRGISEVEVELEPDTTILAGRNNSGKSRIISAIQLVLGGRSAEADDFTVGSELEPEIDVFISPHSPIQEADETVFERDVFGAFSNAVQTVVEEPTMDKIAWRTVVTRSSEGYGAKSTNYFLRFDVNSRLWTLPRNADEVSFRQRRVFAVDLINTGRDLRDELARQGSSIRRVLSDLEVPSEDRKQLEDDLVALSGRILLNSATLGSVSKELSNMHELVGSVGKPALSALPLTLEELGRAISVDLDTGAGPLPIRMHGSGSRSLSSLQVQRVLYDRRLGKDGTAVVPLPVTLVEEPEAHLHPQAAMELTHLLDKLNGQKIVSTHSAHLVTSVKPDSIRLVHQTEGGMKISDLGPAATEASATHRVFRPATYGEEMDKLRRLVERPFGELIFSSAIVLGDGATERAFLPIVLRHALKEKSHGVSVIDPGSLTNELASAVVKFAVLARLPLFVFADSDESGAKAVANLEKLAGTHGLHKVWIVEENGSSSIRGAAIESMLVSFDEELCLEACNQVRPDGEGELLRRLKKIKGSSGGVLAALLVSKYPEISSWPAPVQELISAIRTEV